MRRRLSWLRPLAAAMALVLSFSTLAIPVALAHDFEVPGGVQPGTPNDPKDPGGLNQPEQPPINFPPDQDGTVGAGIDPIDIRRGEFIMTRQDLLWPGRELAVDLTVTYRSRSAYNGPFGYGWDLSYNRRLRKLANNNVVLLAGTNRTDEFTFTAPDTFTAPAGIYKTLVQHADGTTTLTSKHGDQESFDVNGNLTRIQDRHGNTLTFTYDAAGLLPITGASAYFVNQTSGIIARDYRLTRITDTMGRRVDLTYNANGRLIGITYAGRTITYGYDATGTGDLISVTTPASVEFPAGLTIRYAYANHNLTTITDPKGQTYLTNVYDAATDRVTQQTYGTGTSRLAYSAPFVCPAIPGSGAAGYSVSLSPSVAAPGAALTVTWTVPADRATHTSDWIGLYRKDAPNTTYGSWFYTNGRPSGSATLTAGSSPDFYEARYLLDSGYTSVASSNTVCVGASARVPGPVSTELTDRNGFRTRYDFDAAGHITRMEQFTDGNPPDEPTAYVTVYEYNAAGERTRVVFPRGNSIEYAYDEQGNLREVRRKKIGAAPGVADPSDLVTTFTYEPRFNLLKTVTDPRRNTTTYTYDDELGEPAQGRLRRIIGPAVNGVSPQTTFTYTPTGQVETVKDPTGVVTKYTYDPVTGQPATITEGWGTSVAGMTRLTYDEAGNVLTETDPNGNRTRFAYNALNQLMKATAPPPLLFDTHYAYDANGNLLQADQQAAVSLPGLRPPPGTANPLDGWQTTRYGYSALDQLASVSDDLGQTTRWGYDPTGNRTAITDAKQQKTTYVSDERNLLWTLLDAATPPGVTEYRYDANGNLSRILDANRQPTDYAYDDFDRLSRVTYADGSHEDYGYDANGNLTSRVTPAGQPITYEYDALNRLSQKLTPDGTTAFTYDLAGRLLTATNAAGTVRYAYDARGRVQQTTFPNRNSVGSRYDAVGNRTVLIYPDNQAVITTYDALNRVVAVSQPGPVPSAYPSPSPSASPLCQLEYDALSRRTVRRLADGTRTTYRYDMANRLLELLTQRSVTLLLNFIYTYDPLGNRRTALHNHQVPAARVTYDYDPLSQLTVSDTGQVKTRYVYDAAGNRLQAGTNQLDYHPNRLNQYERIGPIRLRYDLNGNLTYDAINTYVYDAEHHLLRVSGGFGTAVYTYDALGRRISATTNGVTTQFLYDGDQVVAELNGQGKTVARYVYGPGLDEPLLMLRGSNPLYYHADSLGSIVALTYSSGKIAETYQYDPFGQPTTVSKLGNPYLFAARPYDAATRLMDARARVYSPDLGRFLQRDPFPSDLNPYRYVGSVGKLLPYFKPVNETNPYLYTGNNPITRIDPLGLWYIDVNVGGGWFGGVGTAGLIFSDKGIYWYGGGGVGTPGLSGALTWSPFDPTPGWNFGTQGPIVGIFGGQVGADAQGKLFVEAGLVSPGYAGTAYYVHEIWTPPTPAKKGCEP